MTPYEAWTGEKPVVKHLCVFGCNVYIYVPKEERGRLDRKVLLWATKVKQMAINYLTQCNRRSFLAEML